MHALRTSALVAAALVAGVGLLAPTAGAEPPNPTLVAGLSGAREVPGPGDRNGSGLATVTVDAASEEICYELTVRNIAAATAAHIHEADRHDAGDVVQPLDAPTDGSSSGCVVNTALAPELVANPDGYYVNVHNSEFPGGAVRGQLAGQRS
jgi:hypothetical protein